MRFTDLNEYEIARLGKLCTRNKVEWICFFKHISYKAQIFVLEDKYALDILTKIYTVGGAIRKKDLIDISYNSDKNMYNYISKLLDLNLLKQEGKRDSIIGLTSVSLSIVRKVKVNNSINISSITSNHLDRAAFLLRVHEKDKDIIIDEYIFTTYFTDIFFNDYAKDEKHSNKRIYLEKLLQKDFASLKSNQIYINSFDKVTIYALNSMDLELKLKNLSEMSFLKKTGYILNLKEVILPNEFKGKQKLEELKKLDFTYIKLKDVKFEFI